MDSILDELYTSLYHRDPQCLENRALLWEEYLPMCKQIQDAFGLDFVDRFTLLGAKLEAENGASQFRQGFRLGARLMLELFTPA